LKIFTGYVSIKFCVSGAKVCSLLIFYFLLISPCNPTHVLIPQRGKRECGQGEGVAERGYESRHVALSKNAYIFASGLSPRNDPLHVAVDTTFFVQMPEF
jgi:hypothetical protein